MLVIATMLLKRKRSTFDYPITIPCKRLYTESDVLADNYEKTVPAILDYLKYHSSVSWNSKLRLPTNRENDLFRDCLASTFPNQTCSVQETTEKVESTKKQGFTPSCCILTSFYKTVRCLNGDRLSRREYIYQRCIGISKENRYNTTLHSFCDNLHARSNGENCINPSHLYFIVKPSSVQNRVFEMLTFELFSLSDFWDFSKVNLFVSGSHPFLYNGSFDKKRKRLEETKKTRKFGSEKMWRIDPRFIPDDVNEDDRLLFGKTQISDVVVFDGTTLPDSMESDVTPVILQSVSIAEFALPNALCMDTSFSKNCNLEKIKQKVGVPNTFSENAKTQTQIRDLRVSNIHEKHSLPRRFRFARTKRRGQQSTIYRPSSSENGHPLSEEVVDYLKVTLEDFFGVKPDEKHKP